MRQWIRSALAQIMACRLYSAMPLSKPMLGYCQLDSCEQNSVKFEFELYNFHSRKCIWKCCLPKWQPFCPGGYKFKSLRPSDAWMAPSHYLNQCWNIVNWTLGNKIRWNFNQNSNIFIEENMFENAVCKMLFISSRPQCVKGYTGSSDSDWVPGYLAAIYRLMHSSEPWPIPLPLMRKVWHDIPSKNQII